MVKRLEVPKESAARQRLIMELHQKQVRVTSPWSRPPGHVPVFTSPQCPESRPRRVVCHVPVVSRPIQGERRPAEAHAGAPPERGPRHVPFVSSHGPTESRVTSPQYYVVSPSSQGTSSSCRVPGWSRGRGCSSIAARGWSRGEGGWSRGEGCARRCQESWRRSGCWRRSRYNSPTVVCCRY